MTYFRVCHDISNEADYAVLADLAHVELSAASDQNPLLFRLGDARRACQCP